MNAPTNAQRLAKRPRDVTRRCMGVLHRGENEELHVFITAVEGGPPFLQVERRFQQANGEWTPRGGYSVRRHEMPILEAAIAELKATLADRAPSSPATPSATRPRRDTSPRRPGEPPASWTAATKDEPRHVAPTEQE